MPTAAAGSSHRNVSSAAMATQLKGRRGSAAKSAASTETAVDTIEVENFAPPAWRTVFNKRADLGDLFVMTTARGLADL